MFAMEEKVRFSECDQNCRLAPAGLVNYFQDCCNLQSLGDGIDVDSLFGMGKVWLLNSWHIVIDRLPEAFDDITVYTWPYAFRGFYGMRNFKLEDSSGEVCAYADSTWTLMDTATGKPARMTGEMQQYYHLEPAYPMEYEGRKIQVLEEGELTDRIEVKRHHIDVNNHMNNAQYVLEASDCVPKDFVISGIRAEYRKQTLLGEQLELYRVIEEESVAVIMKDTDGFVHAIVKFDGKTGKAND